MSSAVPVVIGVGDIKNRSSRLEDAFEPLELMLQAIAVALKDTGISAQDAHTLQQSIDSISVVANWTWPYPNAPELLVNKLGCQATYLHESEHGGNAPAELFDEAARRIASGQSKVAIVTGGEALASCEISRELRMIKFDHNWLTFAPSGRIPSFKKVPTSGLDACGGYNFYLGTGTQG